MMKDLIRDYLTCRCLAPVLGMALFVGAGLATPAHADIIAQDRFAYADGFLAGQNGGTGWSGAYTDEGANFTVASGVITASGPSGYAGNNKRGLTQTINLANFPGGEVWLGFDGALELTGDWGFGGISFFTGLSENGLIGAVEGRDMFGIGGANNGATGAHRTIIKFNLNTAAVSLWAGTYGSSVDVSGAPLQTGSLNINGANILRFAIYTGNMQLDNVVLATTFDEVNIKPSADLLTFGPGAMIGLVTNNVAAISWTVPFGSDKAALSPTITLSAGAVCDKASGATNDFTSPVAYTVISSDNLITNVYTVTVTVAPDEMTLLWNLASGGVWDLSMVNWKGQSSGEAMPFINGKHVIFDNAAGGTITLATGMEPASTTVSAPSGTYTFSGGPLAGTGALTKSGSGILQLTGSNTYSGTTTISSGTLRIGNGGATGTLGSGSVVNDGTLSFWRTDNTTFSGTMTGVGLLQVAKGGTLTLASGANITQGALCGGDSSGASLGSGTFTVQSGATLTVTNIFFLGNQDNQSGTMNQTGGTVNLTTLNADYIRIGHWDLATSAYNLSGGTLNATNATIALSSDFLISPENDLALFHSD